MSMRRDSFNSAVHGSAIDIDVAVSAPTHHAAPSAVLTHTLWPHQASFNCAVRVLAIDIDVDGRRV